MVTSMVYVTTAIGVQQIAKDTYEVTVVRPVGFAFQLGQYTQVALPQLLTSDPKGNTRQFSIASNPSEANELRFVFRDTGSGYKKTLTSVKAGDTVMVEAAAGSFIFSLTVTRPQVFIAGGVGIATFISYLQQFAMDGGTQSITLIYGNQAPDYAAYISFLRSLKASNLHFTLEEVYKRPTPELFASYTKKRLDALWSVVGPPGMVATAVHGLQKAGISAQSIRQEPFTGY